VLVRELKEAGHFIIISTSRLMQECGGNVGAVIAKCGHQTLTTLASLNIPYDEIHFGQPAADLYIDSSIACAAVDTEKDVGWRLRNFNRSAETGMIAARHFNQVQIEGNYVIKTSSRSVLRGEMFFYAHLPADISDIFPTLISSSDTSEGPVGAMTPPLVDADFKEVTDGGGTSEDGVPAAAGDEDTLQHSVSLVKDEIASMTLQRINGVTFSHLMTNRCLTTGRLTLFLQTMLRLHRSDGDLGTKLPISKLDLNANYLPKIEKRFAAHRKTYLNLLPDAESLFAKIQDALASYQTEERWHYSNVIHGDPVFSNVLMTDEGRIYLLDMRGEVGKSLTLQGDVLYDLSKIYQSLLGYDFILLGIPLQERDAEILEELRNTFRAFVAEHYRGVSFLDVIKLTASHYFGIVPLHVNQDHRLAYLQTATALMSSIPSVD